MKKTLSVLLTIAMLLSLSVCAFATEGGTEPQTTEVYIEVIPADNTNSQPTLQAEVNTPSEDAAVTVSPSTMQESGVLENNSLQAVVNISAPEAEIEFKDNVEFNGGAALDKDQGGLTVDLGGNEVTISDPGVGSTGTETLGIQHKKDSGELIITSTDEEGKFTEEKGKLTFTNNDEDDTTTTGKVEGKDIKVGIQNYEDLTITNVEISGGEGVQYILSNNEGKVVIGAGTVITATALQWQIG